MINLHASILSSRLFAACCVFSCILVPCKAVPITLNGINYDVEAATPGLSGSDFIATLENQPWWGSYELAESAATQVGEQLGFPFENYYGPLFVFNNPGFLMAYVNRNDGIWSGISNVPFPNSQTNFTFAVTTPVPDTSATLALLGASLLGLAALRRRFAA